MREDLLQILIGNEDLDRQQKTFPICLDDKDTFYFIKKGTVDLFAANIINGKPTGARRKLFSIGSDNFIFPMLCVLKSLLSDLTLSKHSFIAVPVGEIEIISLKTTTLKNIISIENDQIIKEITTLIDNWIKVVSFLVRSETGSEMVVTLKKGKNILKAGCLVKSKNEILWASNPECIAIKNKEYIDFPYDVFLPISDTCLFQVKENSEIEALTTSEVIKGGSFIESLSNYNSIAAEILEYWYLYLEAEEKKLYERKIAEEANILKKACIKLGSIFAKGKEDTVFLDDANTLFSALKVLGNFLNIKFVDYPASDNTALSLDMRIRMISEISNIRSRRVSLDDKWYKNDSGPLLGFMKESLLPVAILPDNNKRYFFYDKSGKKVFIKSKEISLFENFAYFFYKPMLADEIRSKDLFSYYLFGNKKNIIFVVIIGIVSGLFGLIMPWSTGIIFDYIIPEADRSQLLQISIIIFACTIIISLLNFVKSMTVLNFSSRTRYAVQAAVWDRLLTLPVSFFKDYTAGDLTQRSMGVLHIQAILNSTVINTFLDAVFSISFLLLLFYYSVSLAFMAVALSLAFIITSTLFSWIILKYQKKLVALEGEISGMIYQFISAISKVRMCGAENRILNRWAEKFYTKKKLSHSVGVVSNISRIVNSFFPIAVSLILFSWVIFKITKGSMGAGSFMAFNTAYISFQNSLLNLSSTFIQVLSVLPIYQRLKPILETKPEINNEQIIPKRLTGKVEVNDVSFKYDKDDEEVLKNVSISAESGEFVAIVGKSGSGKSTLMRLLLGFEKANKGMIYYDNHDISLLNKKELRRQFGVVLQNSNLIQGSIFENIVGSLPLTMEDAWEAVRMAGCEDDIKEMPMGLHTLITAGGGTISGGQKQRLMIARALVRKPSIIFFDEATSALDNKTQAIVSQTIEKLNITRIVIAHRLSSIINADKIYVLDSGRVVQSGTFEGLVKQEGAFKELASRQML